MKSQTLGKSTSEVVILKIDRHGLWLYTNAKEYFLPYEQFPWFKVAKTGSLSSWLIPGPANKRSSRIPSGVCSSCARGGLQTNL
jgi:hypothetical protein